MAFEIQSKLREMKAMGGLPSNWKVEFINLDLDPEKGIHLNIDFNGPGVDKAQAEAMADKLLKALNDE